MLHRFVNGVKVWHLLLSHVVVGVAFLILSFNLWAGIIALLVCFSAGLFLAVRSSFKL